MLEKLSKVFKSNTWLLYSGVVFLYTLAFWMRSDQLPLADEIDFTKPMAKWMESGPERWGMWHAPFYPWFLYLFSKVFGFTVAVERLLGFISIGIAAWFLFKAANQYRSSLSELKKTLILVFGLISPIALGSALVLDYDNTLVVASFSLYCFLLVCFENATRKSVSKDSVVMGAALGLCLMSKETTPLIFPLGLLFTWQSRFGFNRALAYSVFSGVVGICFFSAFTYLWCSYYSIPFLAVFEMDLGRIGDHATKVIHLDRGFLRLLWTKISPVFWMGLPMGVLFFWQLPRLLAHKGAIRGITVIVLGVIAVYTFVLTQRTFHFPKYMACVLYWIPWLLIVTSPSRNQGKTWILPLSAVFLISYFPDPMFVLYDRSLTGLLESHVIYALVFVFWLWLKSSKSTRSQSPDLYHFLLILSVGLSLSYTKTAIFEERSITYWYGERALPDAKEYMTRWKKKYSNGRMISPAKDIAWAGRDLGAKYIDDYKLGERSRKYCRRGRPLLIITRVRESTSFERSEHLRRYRKCLKIKKIGPDILVGSTI